VTTNDAGDSIGAGAVAVVVVNGLVRVAVMIWCHFLCAEPAEPAPDGQR
jgi:hypothetical protein